MGRRSPSGPWLAWCLGAANAWSAFLSGGAGQGGVEGEPAVGLAVAVVPHRQPGRRGRGAFLALEEFGFVGVGGVGVDDLEQAAAEDLQGLGVELAGLLDQVGLGVGDQVGVEVVGEVVDRPGDHLGLLHMQVTSGEGRAGRLVGVQCRREPDRPVSGRAGEGGVVGEPVRGRGGTGLAGHVDGLGVGEQPGLQLGQLGLAASTSSESRWSRRRPSTTTEPRRPTPGRCARRRPRGSPGAGGGRSLSWVNSSTGHRQSRARNPLFHKGFRDCDPTVTCGWT